MNKEIKSIKKSKKLVLGRSMGRKEVLRGKGRVKGMEAGGKVGGNRKTGCREATGAERGEGKGRNEKCLARNTKVPLIN